MRRRYARDRLAVVDSELCEVAMGTMYWLSTTMVNNNVVVMALLLAIVAIDKMPIGYSTVW